MISIIVPVYNVDKYLSICLESIQKQDYKDFEAILVDDGSTDTSGTICDDFQRQDIRFKTIHQQNQGVSVARNTGLLVASGEYIAFIDGDDYIHPKFLSTLYSAIRQTSLDIAMINGQILFEYLNPTTVSIPTPIIFDQNHLIKNFFSNSNYDVQYLAVWNKLYKKSIIKGLKFKDIVSEDGIFNLQVYLRTSNISYVNANLYYYMQHQNSLTHESNNTKRIIDNIKPFYLYSQYIPRNNLVYRAYFLEKLFKKLLNIRFNSRNTLYLDYANHETNKAKSLFYDEFKNNKFISNRVKFVIIIFMKFAPFYNMFRWSLEKKALAKQNLGMYFSKFS